MGSDVQSLRSFTFRTVLFKLVLDSRPCFYAVQENVIKQNGIDKIIVDPWHFNQVGTVFRLPDGSNISVISFVSFHPQYHGVSVDMFSIGNDTDNLSQQSDVNSLSMSGQISSS